MELKFQISSNTTAKMESPKVVFYIYFNSTINNTSQSNTNSHTWTINWCQRMCYLPSKSRPTKPADTRQYHSRSCSNACRVVRRRCGRTLKHVNCTRCGARMHAALSLSLLLVLLFVDLVVHVCFVRTRTKQPTSPVSNSAIFTKMLSNQLPSIACYECFLKQ